MAEPQLGQRLEQPRFARCEAGGVFLAKRMAGKSGWPAGLTTPALSFQIGVLSNIDTKGNEMNSTITILGRLGLSVALLSALGCGKKVE